MLPAGCGYQGYEFGSASYPDSICYGGRLYDADRCDDAGNLYEPLDGIVPCPICHPDAAVRWHAGRSSGTRKECFGAARMLVADIRRNRGVAEVTP